MKKSNNNLWEFPPPATTTGKHARKVSRKDCEMKGSSWRIAWNNYELLEHMYAE
jgi:hypothetical protein